RILRQSCSAWTACGVQVAHDHVIKQYVVQPPRSKPAADEVGVDVQDWNFGKGMFQGADQRRSRHCSDLRGTRHMIAWELGLAVPKRVVGVQKNQAIANASRNSVREMPACVQMNRSVEPLMRR